MAHSAPNRSRSGSVGPALAGIVKNREPYRRHRQAAAAKLQTDEDCLWPDAKSETRRLDEADAEIVHVYPHGEVRQEFSLCFRSSTATVLTVARLQLLGCGLVVCSGWSGPGVGVGGASGTSAGRG
uniref:hypothetical protein n=1 Tax=Kitasatospora sp. NBC_01519 TaxID=2903576 RepID=UPI002F911736